MNEKKEYVKLWLSYRSYFEKYNDAEVGRLVRAMMEYKSSGEEPNFDGNERFIWPAIKRDIDDASAAQKKKEEVLRKNGQKGGRPPKKVQPVVSEKAGSPKEPSPVADDGREAAIGAVMSAYMDKIQPTPSSSSLDELKGFVEVMGADCCLRAIDIAVDSKKTTWGYIRAILQDKQAKGVRCLADWDALEEKRRAEREGQRGRQEGKKQPPPSLETSWHFGAELTGVLSEWFNHMNELNRPYSETGRKHLIDEVRKQADAHGETAVARLIRFCMSNGWKSIVWEKMEDMSRLAKGLEDSRGKRESPQEDFARMERYLQQLRRETGEEPEEDEAGK